LTASAVRPYALGRIVLWSATFDASEMTLDSLAEERIRRVAIANPKHAPYGKRAEEALRNAGVWEAAAPKLVFGENVAQAAQFVQTGNAQAGIIALSLALNPELARQGGYWLIPEHLHGPLEQGFVITKRGGANDTARRFAAHIESEAARETLARFGFALPASAHAATR
jgi:molybdate transport system substrate-binding protein